MNTNGDDSEIENHLDIDRVNYKQIFDSTTSPYLVLKPDLTIVAVNNLYLEMTKTKRNKILYKKIFEVFPEDPQDPDAKGFDNLKSSLERVIINKTPDYLGIIKYNIPDPNSTNGVFLERYWRPVNSPILNENNELVYILHCSEDITNITNIIQMQDRVNSMELANLNLKETRLFLETILDNLPNMVFVKSILVE